jgi:DNA (cytosine-5)-methyltransferase 1
VINECKPTHLDLFSGIGGFALAAQWAGFRTVAFVEREPFCQKILAQHWPHVPVYSDICQFGGKPFSGVDLLTGGFPCQPFSYSGEQRGKADDRYLWPEMFRVIRTVKPRWIIGENVAGLDGLGLDDCISDLESIGYEVAPPLEIPACSVDARHIRNRIWILANANSFSSGASRANRVEGTQAASVIAAGEQSALMAHPAGAQNNGERGDCECGRNALGWPIEAAQQNDGAANHNGSCRCGEDVSDTNSARREELNTPCESDSQGQHTGNTSEGWREWPTESGILRVAHGIPNRTHRLKGLGNAIVPAVAFQIIKEIRKLI